MSTHKRRAKKAAEQTDMIVGAIKSTCTDEKSRADRMIDEHKVTRKLESGIETSGTRLSGAECKTAYELIRSLRGTIRLMRNEIDEVESQLGEQLVAEWRDRDATDKDKP